MHDLDVEREFVTEDPGKLAILFKEMIQMCLWCVRSIPRFINPLHD